MPEDYSPGPRQIVATILDIWKEDPESENLSYAKLLARVKEAKATDGWVLSEKRMKAALKEFNLQPNQPKPTFVKFTKSELVPGIQSPPGTRIQMSKAKGKALFATKSFRAGEKIWEEVPLVQAADPERLRLMRGGRCCAYCARLLRTTADGAPLPRGGIACNYCTANWCSNNCKRLDIGHTETYHPVTRTSKPRILSSKWKLYEQHCMDNDWNAGFLYAVTLLHKIKHGANSHYARVMAGMAQIRQDERAQRILGESLEYEQNEELWKRGHLLLAAAVKPVYELEYEEYMFGLGMVNLNNLNGCLFELYANLNHSCEPNISVMHRSESRADGIVVLAKTDIEAGQELTTTYVNPDLDYETRQYQLRVNWGFLCACPRCKRAKAAKLPPAQPAKPALKTQTANGENGESRQPAKRERSKSVHFEKNPVTSEVPVLPAV